MLREGNLNSNRIKIRNTIVDSSTGNWYKNNSNVDDKLFLSNATPGLSVTPKNCKHQPPGINKKKEESCLKSIEQSKQTKMTPVTLQTPSLKLMRSEDVKKLQFFNNSNQDSSLCLEKKKRIAPRSALQFRVGPHFSNDKRFHKIVQDSTSSIVTPEIHPRIDRGFDLVAGKWTGYKRNYFTLVTAFQIKGIADESFLSDSFHVIIGDEQVPIKYFATRLLAKCCGTQEDASLVQHTSKRDKGPQQTPPLVPLITSVLPDHQIIKKTSNVRAGSKLHIFDSTFTLDRESSTLNRNINQNAILYNYPDNSVSKVAKFERIQFSCTITERSFPHKSKLFKIVSTLGVFVEGNFLSLLTIKAGKADAIFCKETNTTFIPIASKETPPLIIRGRSPANYQAAEMKLKKPTCKQFAACATKTNDSSTPGHSLTPKLGNSDKPPVHCTPSNLQPETPSHKQFKPHIIKLDGSSCKGYSLTPRLRGYDQTPPSMHDDVSVEHNKSSSSCTVKVSKRSLKTITLLGPKWSNSNAHGIAASFEKLRRKKAKMNKTVSPSFSLEIGKAQSESTTQLRAELIHKREEEKGPLNDISYDRGEYLHELMDKDPDDYESRVIKESSIVGNDCVDEIIGKEFEDENFAGKQFYSRDDKKMFENDFFVVDPSCKIKIKRVPYKKKPLKVDHQHAMRPLELLKKKAQSINTAGSYLDFKTEEENLIGVNKSSSKLVFSDQDTSGVLITKKKAAANRHKTSVRVMNPCAKQDDVLNDKKVVLEEIDNVFDVQSSSFFEQRGRIGTFEKWLSSPIRYVEEEGDEDDGVDNCSSSLQLNDAFEEDDNVFDKTNRVADDQKIVNNYSFINPANNSNDEKYCMSTPRYLPFATGFDKNSNSTEMQISSSNKRNRIYLLSVKSPFMDASEIDRFIHHNEINEGDDNEHSSTTYDYTVVSRESDSYLSSFST